MMTRPLILLAIAVGLAAACARADEDEPAPSMPPPPAPNQNAPAALPSIRLTRAFPRIALQRPVLITNVGDDRLFVVNQKGRIQVFANRSDVEGSHVFLDLREKVHTGHNEEGLLGLAFDPDYADNRHFYVYYSASPPRRSVLSRFTADANDPNVADPDSERVVLEVPQPYGNHNGGAVQFGPDGYLYLSLGDGGSANDPHGHGQDLTTLLGTILRIDVRGGAADRPYTVPADNPFVGRADVRPEIWAYGLRNVWRMSFDRATGDLWAGDVGQNDWEEIDLIVKGGNYGWSIREGAHPFRAGAAAVPLIDPVVESGAGCSPTGRSSRRRRGSTSAPSARTRRASCTFAASSGSTAGGAGSTGSSRTDPPPAGPAPGLAWAPPLGPLRFCDLVDGKRPVLVPPQVNAIQLTSL
ncbi:MAG: PQQ-dependent sugar dehydrogenase [Planctomycetota bacterium]|jgi:glucose/arabinose dehydrogenase